jgi:FKBP-type peptidyl-prolyl cis-trans isomerase
MTSDQIRERAKSSHFITFSTAKLDFMIFFALILAGRAGQVAIIPDGKITKEIIWNGTGGSSPKVNQVFKIHYIGMLADGKVFDSSRARGAPFTFTDGRGVVSGWSIAVSSMTVGERATFSINWEYGYGEYGYPPVVPPRADLMFDIELMKIL